jgi:hypothetical protein
MANNLRNLWTRPLWFSVRANAFDCTAGILPAAGVKNRSLTKDYRWQHRLT